MYIPLIKLSMKKYTWMTARCPPGVWKEVSLRLMPKMEGKRMCIFAWHVLGLSVWSIMVGLEAYRRCIREENLEWMEM